MAARGRRSPARRNSAQIRHPRAITAAARSKIFSKTAEKDTRSRNLVRTIRSRNTGRDRDVTRSPSSPASPRSNRRSRNTPAQHARCPSRAREDTRTGSVVSKSIRGTSREPRAAFLSSFSSVPFS